MAQYLRVVRRGKNNVRVELPDHSTTLVPVAELPMWELIDSNNSQSVINLDDEANFTTSTTESTVQETTQVDEVPKEIIEKVYHQLKKQKKSAQPSYRAGNFHRNSNGLGIDHPYESVNMNYEPVQFDDNTISPF